MRIAIINELVERGGTEVQTLREVENFRAHGDEVLHVTFDDSYEEFYEAGHCNIPLKWGKLHTVMGKLWVDRSLFRKVVAILDEYSPDIVHVNNVLRVPITIYEVASRYPSVLTIRDYSAVCPKGTNIQPDCTECRGLSFGRCILCSRNVRDVIKVPYFWHKSRLRNRGFGEIVSPSEELARYYRDRFESAICINNPLDVDEGSLREKGREKKTYLYYGSIEKNKGVEILLDAWRVFACEKNDVELCFAGKISEGFSKVFWDHLKYDDKIKYLGWRSQEEINDLLADAYCVVVPSLWMENYPNTVLEALAHRTLVIGSDRGGIPELICDSRFLFDVLDQESVVSVLQFTYEMGDDAYKRIAEDGLERVRENNNSEVYYKKLARLYSRLLHD